MTMKKASRILSALLGLAIAMALPVSASADSRQYMNYTGQWSGTTRYVRNAVVSFENAMYVARTANRGQTPTASSNVWTMITGVGPQGPAGPQGVPGATGAPGAQGPAGVIGAYGSFYSDSVQPIVGTTLINFTATSPLKNLGLGGLTTVTIPPSGGGTYRLNYCIRVDVVAAGSTTGASALLLDGLPIPGSEVTMRTALPLLQTIPFCRSTIAVVPGGSGITLQLTPPAGDVSLAVPGGAELVVEKLDDALPG
jgi:hypothetical protein